MAKKQVSLPAHRAFVVQFHADAQPEQGLFRGRVEHVVSYQSAHFESLEELIAFMVRVLGRRSRDGHHGDRGQHSVTSVASQF